MSPVSCCVRVGARVGEDSSLIFLTAAVPLLVLLGAGKDTSASRARCPAVRGLVRGLGRKGFKY